MARRRTRKQVGQTSFFDPDAGTVMTSREEVELHADRAVTRIGPMDPQQPARVIETTDRGAVRYTRTIVAAREAHARRVAPVRPNFKPARARRPRPRETCSLCGDLGYGADEDGNQVECPECNL